MSCFRFYHHRHPQSKIVGVEKHSLQTELANDSAGAGNSCTQRVRAFALV